MSESISWRVRNSEAWANKKKPAVNGVRLTAGRFHDAICVHKSSEVSDEDQVESSTKGCLGQKI